MRRFLLTFICVLICLTSQAGDIKRVSITYDYTSDNSHETPEQAELNAKQQARIKAMEKAFGIDVSGITAIAGRNQTDGTESRSRQDVYSLRSTAVRGEWIETTEERVIEKEYVHGFWHVRVYVEGRARSRAGSKVEIEYALLNSESDRTPRELFLDGDNIYLAFSSPVAGFLAVYLVDAEEMAYCLLPEAGNTIGAEQIEANHDYLFFSKNERRGATEYVLHSERAAEQNTIYIVFSDHRFAKPVDKASGRNSRQEPLPRRLSHRDLLKWLAAGQTRDEHLDVRTEVITINKPE